MNEGIEVLEDFLDTGHIRASAPQTNDPQKTAQNGSGTNGEGWVPNRAEQLFFGLVTFRRQMKKLGRRPGGVVEVATDARNSNRNSIECAKSHQNGRMREQVFKIASDSCSSSRALRYGTGAILARYSASSR